jgi:hypothetical protein
MNPAPSILLKCCDHVNVSTCEETHFRNGYGWLTTFNNMSVSLVDDTQVCIKSSTCLEYGWLTTFNNMSVSLVDDTQVCIKSSTCIEYLTNIIYHILLSIHHDTDRNQQSTAHPSGTPSSTPVFSGVRVTRSLVFCVVFCRSLFFLLSFFCWPLCCLSFSDLRIPAYTNEC